ncbi:MAG: hypothetical protein ACOX6L_12425 [Syntrophomonadaceae bacterium]|jgi:hypothetical protein
MQTDGSQENKLNKANFLIQIQYRHNSSWQGRIIWLDTKQTLVFRSFLELAMLIREALGGADGIDQPIEWEKLKDIL